jgi:U2-associated protein SR140
MTDKRIAQFPDVGNKLHAPSKKSLFERQKAEAEAKRLREEAETKAVYEDFVKSFDDEDDEDGFTGGGAGFGAPKRHFGAGQGLGAPPTGGRGYSYDRGKVGSGPGTLGQSNTGLGKKRPYEAFQQGRRDDRGGLLAFDDYDDRSSPARALKRDYDDDDRRGGDEEERAVPKPTLRLASLPPGTSPAVIKALLPQNLTVDAVRILPSTSTTHAERKSMSAIVTLSKETAANDIDATVNSLQNRYLGYGYYLNLHRHLSSAVISNSASLSGLGASTSQPFGAKPVIVASAGRGAPPPHQRGGFAPPTSYAPIGQQLNRGPLLHVPVTPPQDIKELRLIHKVIESLLTHGPEFEALLMSRPDVQREEKWAWLWDSRSAGGVWYRWRLWEVLTGTQTRRGQGKYLPLFEGSSAWKQPDQPLAWEYTTKIDEFVSDSEYNSSDEDDSGDEGVRRPNHGGGGPPDPSLLADDGKAYLNPLEKAKLTHLLSRLPTSTGKLRKGDVARVTAFAISHAGRGADEVVSAIVSNIEKPFAYTSGNPDRKKDKESGDDIEDEDTSDTSAASLIGVYLISDILSSSSTSGVRHAWRYRQLFETALKQRHAFEGLGRMERKMKWGRLRAEKWKRSVGNILSLWEGWCVFPQESQEHFVNVFNNPPMNAKEEQEAGEKEVVQPDKGKSRWKTVEVEAKEVAAAAEGDVDGESMMQDDDVDGEPMDDDVDGVPMEEDDIDGIPMDDDPTKEGVAPAVEPMDSKKPEILVKVDTAPVTQPRRRPKAVDMFADSDDED